LTAGNYATRSPNDELIYRYILPALNEKFKYDYDKIKAEAPILESFTIIKPPDSVSRSIAKFSGHWYGRGDFSIAGQLVVEKIDSTKAFVIYSWGDHPEGYFQNGWVRKTATVDTAGKISFYLDSATLTFELDKHEDVLIGYYEIGDVSAKLIMSRL